MNQNKINNTINNHTTYKLKRVVQTAAGTLLLLGATVLVIKLSKVLLKDLSEAGL